MDKIKELLAVLDMPEEKQWKRLRPFTDANGDDYERGLYSECLRKRVLADLAFRLRDEAVKANHNNWGRAVLKIHICHAPSKGYDSWWQNHSQPIHWIIAALIAKELAKKEIKTVQDIAKR